MYNSTNKEYIHVQLLNMHNSIHRGFIWFYIKQYILILESGQWILGPTCSDLLLMHVKLGSAKLARGI